MITWPATTMYGMPHKKVNILVIVITLLSLLIYYVHTDYSMFPIQLRTYVCTYVCMYVHMYVMIHT